METKIGPAKHKVSVTLHKQIGQAIALRRMQASSELSNHRRRVISIMERKFCVTFFYIVQ